MRARHTETAHLLTRLDDELGTLITREQGDVDRTAFHIGRVFVHDGIQFGVAHCGFGREEERKKNSDCDS